LRHKEVFGLDRLQQIKTDWIEEKDTYQFRQLAVETEDIEWLIEQAEKVEGLEKRFKEQIQNNYFIICGDDATEERQGSYYCYECCK
jgi:hypothetical protein